MSGLRSTKKLVILTRATARRSEESALLQGLLIGSMDSSFRY